MAWWTDWIKRTLPTPPTAPTAPSAPVTPIFSPSVPLPLIVPDFSTIGSAIALPGIVPGAPSVERNRPGIGSRGLALITSFEGYKSASYPDSKGVWTIGYGTTRVNGRPVVQGMSCSKDQAAIWLADDTDEAYRSVVQLVKVPLTQNQLDSLICFVYNVGHGGFSGSSLLRTINTHAPVTESLFTRWNKITVVKNGRKVMVELAGLTRRRKAEFALYKSL